MERHAIRQVLNHYSALGSSRQVEPLGSAGGFSGARFWQVRASGQIYCLRRWPQEHPDEERLLFVHSVLRHVAGLGFEKLPVPLPTSQGKSFIETDGYLWEMAPWLPGEADYHQRPSRRKLQECMAALAEFHAATASHPAATNELHPSPAIAARRDQLGRLLAGEIDQLDQQIMSRDWPELAERARRLLPLVRRTGPAVLHNLHQLAPLTVVAQPCIRDIWHDHVLFVGDEVSGIVDFGAMKVETVAGDIARLLGSLIGDDPDAWQLGLESYQQIRPLSADELQLIPAFDQSTVLLSGISWLRWIYVQQRRFEHRATIIARLDALISRLEAAQNRSPLH